jgi:hypothetical protein
MAPYEDCRLKAFAIGFGLWLIDGDPARPNMAAIAF